MQIDHGLSDGSLDASIESAPGASDVAWHFGRKARIGYTKPMPIRTFIPGDVTFNPAEVQAMNEAFESGWRALQHAGYKVGQEALAAKIITAAADGERNPERLRDIALAQLGVYRPET